ncbi:MAG: ATP synthase subunit a [Flavobacteriia bacterium]|nr:MAG: ATP synthase subunit a [Flavobacteriia bacterium]
MRCTALLFWVSFMLVLAYTPLIAQHDHSHEEEPQHSEHSAQEAHAAEDTHSEEEFDITHTVMHHIADAHEFHAWGDHEHGFTLPLPIILWTDQGLVSFLSSAFHHNDDGSVVVERNGVRVVKYHEKIYYALEEPNDHHAYIEYGEDHASVLNAKPLDFSITKNVFSLLLSALIMLLIFGSTAAKYKFGGAPKGIAGFMEPLILFVRDEIARPNIEGERYKKFVPYLLTLFFFIWVNNLIGLIPIFPFSANLTGNISVTLSLAFLTLLVTNVSANGGYWKHIFMPPVPLWLWPILVPVEIIGVLSKPFALMIRLFANITAGHIIILSLTSLIFLFGTLLVAPVSVLFVLFMNFIELLVAALQAYIFTLLTALFIGLASPAEHH